MFPQRNDYCVGLDVVDNKMTYKRHDCKNNVHQVVATTARTTDDDDEKDDDDKSDEDSNNDNE